jgi:hypothetical protein
MDRRDARARFFAYADNYLIDVLSQRRATRLLDVDRSTVRYRRKRKDDDADRKLLRALLVAPGVWPRIKT